MSEVWVPVPDYPYEVSSHGRVRNSKGRILKTSTQSGDYLKVSLWKNNRGSNYAIHRLMMLSFVGPRPAGEEVRHLDGNNQNNLLENLVYGTRSDNIRDTVKHGTHYSHGRTLTHCPQGHEYSKDNTYVTKENKRHCRTCGNIRRNIRRMEVRANVPVRE